MASFSSKRKLELIDGLSVQSIVATASSVRLQSNTVVVLAESFVSSALQNQTEDNLLQKVRDTGATFTFADEDASVQRWHCIAFLVCCSLVTFCAPASSYGLFKASLGEVLDLSPEESQNIISVSFLGSALLGFVPGIFYDSYGYTPTLLLGGSATAGGAFLWYWFLQDGGAPNSPGWHELALPLLLMTCGCRAMYVAGMCAIMSIFPARYSATVSAGMAMSTSVGYILVPLLWAHCLPSEDQLDAYNPQTKNLANLFPVANFFYVLAVIYASVTVAGLSIVRWLPSKHQCKASGSSLRSRLRKLLMPSAAALIVLVIASIAFVGTFMATGFAEVAKQAGASVADTQAGMLYIGIAGLCGRFIHGILADRLRTRTRARQAGLDIMFISAALFTLIGFVLLALRQPWEFAASFIGFGFGGFYALLPAAVMITFDTADAGFWIGSLSCVRDLLSAFYGELCSQMEWSSSVHLLGACAATVTICTKVVMACAHWGK